MFMQRKSAFSRRLPDLVTEELVAALSKKGSTFEFKQLFDVVHERLRARNAASGALKNAQANPTDPNAIKQLGAADGALGAVMTRFMALAEAYPDLKANQNMMQLSEELSSTENRIAFARQAYNDGVMSYNNKREVFPNNFIAGMFSFKAAESLELEDPAARKTVKVQF